MNLEELIKQFKAERAKLDKIIEVLEDAQVASQTVELYEPIIREHLKKTLGKTEKPIETLMSLEPTNRGSWILKDGQLIPKPPKAT